MSLSREFTIANGAQLHAAEEKTSTSAPLAHTKAGGCMRLLKSQLLGFAWLFFQGKCWGRAGSSEAQAIGLVPKKTKRQGLKALN